MKRITSKNSPPYRVQQSDAGSEQEEVCVTRAAPDRRGDEQQLSYQRRAEAAAEVANDGRDEKVQREDDERCGADGWRRQHQVDQAAP